ncbi:pilus assembly FimT family protein [Geomonas limicola]|nr:hypothetical protein [Geomonas limicola]
MVLMAILTAIALPNLVVWRGQLNCRASAKLMEMSVRESRSKAITNNIQYMVVFKPNSSSFQVFKGNQAYNTPSTGFSAADSKTVTSSSVVLRSGSTGASRANVYVQLYPNGTAAFVAPDKSTSDNYVSINDAHGQLYQLKMTATGRVTLSKK